VEQSKEVVMKQDKVKLLIIDDDPKVSWILSEGLQGDFEILSARDGIEGIQVASTEKPDLILLDIKMPGMNGMEVLAKLKKADLPSEIIMLSGHGETKYVVESIQQGAAEFVNKPFDVKEVEIHIQSVLEKSRLRQELSHLKDELKAKSQYDSFVGDSQGMLDVKNIIEQVADSELTVLIRGESGTGKEIVARMLHGMSGRSKNTFSKVNCAAIPRDLLEAELFGYEKGAFTGAHRTKPGRFEVANNGTMFLDEIGDMPLELQSKLLQVLEQHEFVRVGGINTINVDLRIVCATNKNLEEAIGNQLFRDDLFYRLNEITIYLPPLRDRKDDIPLLVEHFLDKYVSLYKKDVPPLSREAVARLMEYNYPGNVRQLENLVKQVVVREDEKIIEGLLIRGQQIQTTRSYQPDRQPTGAPVAAGGIDDSEMSENAEPDYSLKRRVSKAVSYEEKKLISEILNKVNWNRRKAAEILEISYRSLLYKIKDYRINEIK
jgi:DNA-binding NtrC family response regulator